MKSLGCSSRSLRLFLLSLPKSAEKRKTDKDTKLHEGQIFKGNSFVQLRVLRGRKHKFKLTTTPKP